MTRLELLNAFLNDRLTAAAEDIFRAVKDTVAEYQAEILRSKEENDRLRRLLNVALQRLLLHPDPQPVHALEDAEPCDGEWRTSVEPPPQVKEEPTPTDLQTDRDSDSAEGNCSGSEPQQRPHQTTLIQTASPAPQASCDIKTETDGEDGRRQSDPETDRTRKTHVSGREGRQGSDGKHGAHVLQVKNARPGRLAPPRSAHPGQSIQRWHSCKECGKGFSFACQLEVHMRWHTKEKPYSCTVCRKSFTTVSMLKRHHRIHTGEKPFRCHVCGKCFNQSAHLNTHFRLHTRDRASWGRTQHGK
ncbi:zinc finger protein 232-like [Sphaeramia orbicularis]|uniref:C2H2-type domain-containing protein n=1 Tax=Sphaeramia orbicularis TaxID=375764 RepID=A0A672YCY5_9TELE|nr:zinc finger protein 232-like [Sphaeramia orbicularis]